MDLGRVVELGEACLELSLPACRHHKLGQDGDVGVRAPGGELAALINEEERRRTLLAWQRCSEPQDQV